MKNICYNITDTKLMVCLKCDSEVELCLQVLKKIN